MQGRRFQTFSGKTLTSTYLLCSFYYVFSGTYLLVLWSLFKWQAGCFGDLLKKGVAEVDNGVEGYLFSTGSRESIPDFLCWRLVQKAITYHLLIVSNINKTKWFNSSTFRHLRFPFSFFLLPVFMFALSQADNINGSKAILAFLILHVLMFPSSNGYNSFQDKDETSIGGIKDPPQVTKSLYYITLLFDILAITLGLFISMEFSVGVLIFTIMSRAYSSRKIRLKKYPFIGFFTVFIFQGGFIYLTSAMAISDQSILELINRPNIICMIISSLFIGSMYPLTQIYQHKSDKNDGVISISYVLGYNGTFIFSGLLFALATLLMTYYFWITGGIQSIWMFILFIIPMIVKMSKWFKKVRKDITHANFENTMAMNLTSSSSMNLYFLILAIFNLIN